MSLHVDVSSSQLRTEATIPYLFSKVCEYIGFLGLGALPLWFTCPFMPILQQLLLNMIQVKYYSDVFLLVLFWVLGFQDEVSLCNKLAVLELAL